MATKRKKKLKNSPKEPVNEPVILDTKLGIQNIVALTDLLTNAVATDGPVTLDIGNVRSVDTAALQVLTAFANSMRAQPGALEWQGQASVLREFVELAGLDRCLEIESGSTGNEPVPVVQVEDELCPVF